MAFATNSGVRIYWRLDGDPARPVLLLLNSIGTDNGLWDLAAPQLKTRFRLLRMDTRGHGASDAPDGDYSLDLLAQDALAVMDAAGVEKAVICGLSLGGMMAMTIAKAAPQRVEAVVLACTSPAMDPKIWQARIDLVRKNGMGGLVEPALQRFFTPEFRAARPEVVGTTAAALGGMAPQGYAGCSAAIRDMALAGTLGAIRAPTLVLAGAKDVATPMQGHGDRIVAEIAGASTTVVDGGHLASLDAPEAFAAAVINFYDSLSGGDIRAAKELLYQNGLKVRRQVLGDAWVDKALAKRTPFNSEFQSMITQIAWGEIWTRPGLDHRTRRLLVIAITAALGRWEEYGLHVRAGLQQGGFSKDDLKEVLMQTAIYAGVPAANTGFAEAGEIIESLEGHAAS